MERFHPFTRQWFEETLGQPTETQIQGWPPIQDGQHALVCAPTGTGKTLTAFLALIDDLLRQHLAGELCEGVQAVYVTPLKSLGNDIRVNLQRPLEGIAALCEAAGLEKPNIRIAIRNGDTTPSERAAMLRHPPHILITTPESLYLLLTAGKSRSLLSHVRTVIVDELHAILDTKRGAHLSISLERLRALCDKEPQRIGLSATLASAREGAAFLTGAQPDGTPRPCVHVQPPDHKRVALIVEAALPDLAHPPEGTVWPAIIRRAYEAALNCRTTLVFVNSRTAAEKMAAGLCALAEDPNFACTHHGCMDKERRLEAERRFKAGELRCLCATSSMELGIDVGEIDLVLQVGCPKEVARGLQRLGRAGHGPRRVSEMRMYPRTAADALESALVGQEMLARAVEPAEALVNCLDVLAQHCVSIAAGGEMAVSELLTLVHGAWGYHTLPEEELILVLRMLSGEYEHRQLKPVRPRLFYDAEGGRISGDQYSRMLAVSGSTIPDRGMFPVYLEDGATRLGELDEEFVFEARVGHRFMLGAFPWQIVRIGRDRVTVKAATTSGAHIPFWKGDGLGRPYALGVRMGAMVRELEESMAAGIDAGALARRLPMDLEIAVQVHELLTRQLSEAGCLATDRQIVLEHFKSESSNDCLMLHSPFGGRVHQGLAILLGDALEQAMGSEVQAYHADDGVLFVSIGSNLFPERALNLISPDTLEDALLRLLPGTALFSMVYRYAASCALMLGMGNRGTRQPLWVQRQRGANSLDATIGHKDHPLLIEAARECIHRQIDVPHLYDVLTAVREGRILITEFHAEKPSPMTGELRMLFMGDAVYATPIPEGARRSTLPVDAETVGLAALRPPSEATLQQAVRPMRAASSPDALHAQLMQEGDLIAGEMDAPYEWLGQLAARGRVRYIEPGLWIAAAQEEAYQRAFAGDDAELSFIFLRALRYRGGMSAAQMAARYALPEARIEACLRETGAREESIEHEGAHWHADIYRRAAGLTRAALRQEATTVKPAAYAALVASIQLPPPGEDRLHAALRPLLGLWLPLESWENAVLPARVPRYRPAMLDRLLLSGAVAWRVRMREDGKLLLAWFDPVFMQPQPVDAPDDLTRDETAIFDALKARGAMFAHGLTALCGAGAQDALLMLLSRGLVVNDSLAPLRVLAQGEMSPRARTRLLSQAGRWALAEALPPPTLDTRMTGLFGRYAIACRETAGLEGIPWGEALEWLRHREYTGLVRRGYYVEGLSGAQFLREEEAQQRAAQLARPAADWAVLPATDPAQVYGKALPHAEGRSFLCVAGSCVVFHGGEVVLLAERYGESLRWMDEAKATEAVAALAAAFSAGRIWADKPRITVRALPGDNDAPLISAGFTREMRDYVLWRKAT